MFQRLAVTLVALAFAGAAAAQQPAPAASPGIKRTILQKVEVPSTNYETILGMAEIAPGMIDGQPEKTLKAGDSYQIPAGIVHDVRTVGGPAKVVAVYMVPKGMALATPAK